LGEDAAAKPGEDRDQRAAKAEPDQRMDDVREVRLVVRVRIEQPEIPGDAEQAEADHQQPGDRAAVERHLQRLVQPGAGRFGGAGAARWGRPELYRPRRPRARESTARMTKPAAV